MAWSLEKLTKIMNEFGCNLLAYDLYPNPICLEMGVSYVDLPELLSVSDIVSLHCPLRPETHHLINDDVIQLLQSFPNVVITAHQAFLTRNALNNIAETTLSNMTDFAEGRPCPNQVKLEKLVTS